MSDQGGPPGPPQGPPPWGAPPLWPPPYGYAYPPPVYVTYAYVPGPAAPLDPLGRPLAEWWRRAVGSLVDLALIYFLIQVLDVVLVIAAFGTATTCPGGRVIGAVASQCGVSSAGVAVLAAVGAVFVLGVPLYLGIAGASAGGRTLGKLAAGVALRDARTGGAVPLWRGLARAALIVLLFLPLGIPLLIAWLAPLWDPKRRTWYDHLTGTLVVRTRL